MPPPAASAANVKSATRTLDVLEYVVAHPHGVAAQNIAAALGIPVSSLSYLLATLADRGYLQRLGRAYIAGPGLDRLRRPQGVTLAERIRPLIKALRRRVNETSSFFEPSGWEVVAVVTETAEHTLRYSIDVGTRTPMHCVSAGKAVLAEMPHEQLERYFAETQRTRFTTETRCGRAELMEDIASVRVLGYARTRNEYSVGISAIGAAVRNAAGVVGAVSVAIPSPRFDAAMETMVVEQVLDLRAALEKLAG